MSGVYPLVARMLYGTGMRLFECTQLRVKDVDLRRRE
jgi:integrase